jgi:nucleoside-diphosphate-sugar epimerase
MAGPVAQRSAEIDGDQVTGRRVLVTGASGFVGHAAVPALLDRGFEVHGTCRKQPVDGLAGQWHVCDLLDPATPRRLVDEVGPSHLLGLAWCTDHGRFWSDPTNLDWARATLALARAFVDAGGRRAVMAGSCTQYTWDESVLGSSGVLTEAATPRRATHLYGRAKQATTDLLEVWSAGVGLSYATGLLFFPYGPFEHPDRLVPSVTRQLLAGRPAETTAGAQVRDFVQVRDVGAALAALVDSDVSSSVNVGSGRGHSVAEVATTVARTLGREDLLRLGALPTRRDEPRAVVADVRRLEHEVGFVPSIDLESGVRDTVEWWRRSSESSPASAGR